MYFILLETNATKSVVSDSPSQDISPAGTKYCYVLRPEQQRSEFPQHDQCVIPKIDTELEANGIWNVVAGVEGKTTEVMFEVNVEAKGKL